MVLCVDEKSGMQALDRSQPMMPGMPERRSHDYHRHGVSSLFAAFNVADGTVISQLRRRHRATEFRKLLVAIDKAVPSELGVHLICHNLATHKTPANNNWLINTRASSSTSHPPGPHGSTKYCPLDDMLDPMKTEIATTFATPTDVGHKLETAAVPRKIGGRRAST